MKLFRRHVSQLGNSQVEAKLLNDVESALNDIVTEQARFIVNDSVWYWINAQGKVRPSVVNSANFITTKFQENLKELGWEIEKTLSDQTIDGFIEVEDEFDLFHLDPSRLLELLREYELKNSKSSGEIATSLYLEYCKRASPVLGDSIRDFETFFSRQRKKIKFRCGVEFETGNIASSFRAIKKLDFLFQEDLIDLGIFVTSNDKSSCAARIWPVSNRNGSFEELDRRNFIAGTAIPLWQIGFAPDGFSPSAHYLASNGTLYSMTPTGKQEQIEEKIYEVFLDNKKQKKLRPL